jgi:hypothetical protein
MNPHRPDGLSRWVGLALVVVATAAFAPAASAAKPKLYTVSLSGDVRNESTQTMEGIPPEGCMGSTSETHRFAVSAGLAPKPTRVPVASYGRLRFKAALTSLTLAAGTETTGSFAPDPDYPPDDPSVCSVPPTKSWPCHPVGEATGKAGAEFALLPNKGRYELYYNRTSGIVACDDDLLPLRVTLLDVGQTKLTKLRVSAVKRLGKGKSVSVSGTVVAPPMVSVTTGGETLNYSLKVKRVR